MICTSIQYKSHREIREALLACEMAEIRLDRCNLTDCEIADCFAEEIPLVATCRVNDLMQENHSLSTREATEIAERRLMEAIEAGAHYIDLEVEFPKSSAKKIIDYAKEEGISVIRSYHDFEKTASYEELVGIINMCTAYQADVVKIVTTATKEEDNEVVKSLYKEEVCSLPLIAFCMGQLGRESRVSALKYGSPFTYAALTTEEASAPGQRDYKLMQQFVYGEFSFLGNGDKVPVLTMPASKSFAQRAIIAASLAFGHSSLSGYSPCGDTDAAIEVAKSLGAKVIIDGDVLEIDGIGVKDEGIDIDHIHTVESGLLTRLMIPLAAQISQKDVLITGEKTLAERPLQGVEQMMRTFGVEVESENSAVPIKVKGALNSGEVQISGEHGSQLISGLLMALALANGNSIVLVDNPKSIPYMFITLDVLKKFGVRVKNNMFGGADFEDGDWSECKQMEFKVKGSQVYKGADFRIEGDWSAAANFLVAGAIFGKVNIRGLDLKSLQADLSIVDILMDAGAFMSMEEDRIIRVARSPLRGFSTDATNCPDLFPILAVLAAFCEGESYITGVDRLAHKESDRGVAILQMLRQMGVHADIMGNDLYVVGKSLSGRLLVNAKEGNVAANSLLKGGNYTSYHDHRMVMALKVASLGASSPIIIDDEACVAKSFPDFMELFNSLR